MKLRQKLIIGALSVTIIPVVVVSTFLDRLSFEAGKESLEEQAKHQLVSVRDSRRSQLKSYLDVLKNQVKTFSDDLMIINAASDFLSSFKDFRSQADKGAITQTALNEYKQNLTRYYTEDFAQVYQPRNTGDLPDMSKLLLPLDADSIALQYHYISANPEEIGKKDNLNYANDSSDYSRYHREYHPHIREYLKAFGYYDIFIVDAKSGDIVYSVFKEIDFSTSLINGPYADSGIGRVFRRANRLTDPDGVVFEDFSSYLPSYNEQAVFIASPIYKNNVKTSILIFQVPISRINEIMTAEQQWERYGLGKTGETYIVGSDNLMRNNSRFLVEDKPAYLAALSASNLDQRLVKEIDAKNTSIGLQRVSTEATQAALLDQTGFAHIIDYRGEMVLSAYTPLEFLGTKWAILAEIDEAEAFAPTVALRDTIFNAVLIIGALVMALSGGIAWFMVRALTRPVSNLEQTVTRVSQGDFAARAEVESDDELGTLAATLNRLLDDRIASLAEAERQNEALNDSIINLLQGTTQLSERDLTAELPVAEDVTGPLSDAISQVVEAISDVLHDVNSIAQTVEGSSQAVKNQSVEVAEAAEKELTLLETSSNRLIRASKSMKDNARLANQCNEMTGSMSTMTSKAYDAVSDTIEGMNDIRTTIHEAEKRIKRLGERSQEINNVADIINNIAEKTHVLALNASMQAAAAGDEGRAFSVIAEEVQRLAESARGATAEISSLVENIQLETSDTAETMSVTITKVVDGAELAEEAGKQMEETTQTAAELVTRIQQISDACSLQAQVSDDLKNRSMQLQETAKETQEKLGMQNEEAVKLVGNSEKLIESVGLFKLPGMKESA
ncbi:methyl-accepting chemotaxis protein [Pleionea sp. CnH1-48]|uniref:methyl-accepting chemotaxis protein n=1 Tax=Pleionea sp. CnH1-48 TaxID=2954494 RepID=UPI002097C8B8|nr:methyl-accepting chemotaxis protein [Pleionea sp. CnH1-48]MCO7223466.1 methyl-accepting chemotaxis protein [Pleionea sp. CnH1-48]